MSKSYVKKGEIICYHDPGSYYAGIGRLILEAKKLPFKSEVTLMAKAEQLTPKYLMTVTNRGVVPMIFHNGNPIASTTYQCEYFDSTFPDSGLRLVPPESEPERRKLAFEFRDLLDNVPIFTITFGAGYYIDRFYKPQFPPPMRRVIRHINNVRITALKKHLKQAKGEKLKEVLNTRLEASLLLVDMWKTPQPLDDGLVVLEAALDKLEAQLENSGGPWILGAEFTMPDIWGCCMMYRVFFLGLSARMWGGHKGAKPRPHVAKYFKTVMKHKSFNKAVRGWWENPMSMMGPMISHSFRGKDKTVYE